MTVVGGTSAREQVAAYTAAHPSIQPHEAPFIVGGLLFQYRKVVTTADYSRHVWRKTKEEKDRKVSVKSEGEGAGEGEGEGVGEGEAEGFRTTPSPRACHRPTTHHSCLPC